MIISIEIRKWDRLPYSLNKLDFSFQHSCSSGIYFNAYNSLKINTNIFIEGEIASGKTAIYNILLYIKNIALNNQNIQFKNCNVSLQFYFNNNIYEYILETNTTTIITEQLVCNAKQIMSNNNTIISKIPNTNVNNWFNNFLLYKSYYTAINTLQQLNHNTYFYGQSPSYYVINNLINKYSQYFNPNGIHTNYEIKQHKHALQNDILEISDKYGTNTYFWSELPLSIKEFIYALPILDIFINNTDKILVIDDADVVASGLILKFLINRFFSAQNGSTPLQCICMSRPITKPRLNKYTIMLKSIML